MDSSNCKAQFALGHRVYIVYLVSSLSFNSMSPVVGYILACEAPCAYDQPNILDCLLTALLMAW